MFTWSKRVILSVLLLGGIIVEASAEPQAKTTGKLELFQALEVATGHCEKLAAAFKQPYTLVEAYKKHYTDADFNRKFTEKQKLDLADYFQGRPNLPDFMFVIPGFETTIPRASRINFNALMTYNLAELVQFDSKAQPMPGNCTFARPEFDAAAPEINDIRLTTIIAFGEQKLPLTYEMQRGNGYPWRIRVLSLRDFNINTQFSKLYTDRIEAVGTEIFIQELCKSSSFSKVGC